MIIDERLTEAEHDIWFELDDLNITQSTRDDLREVFSAVKDLKSELTEERRKVKDLTSIIEVIYEMLEKDGHMMAAEEIKNLLIEAHTGAESITTNTPGDDK